MPRNIEVSVTVKATPARVYKALTDANELMKWFPTVVETDPRPGGSIKFTWKSEDASRNHTRIGEFLELIPEKKVKYTWDARMKNEEALKSGKRMDTVVEFTLSKVDDGTKVTLIHSGWGEGPEWEETFTGHPEGWDFFMKNLKSVYEDGIDRRAEKMQMKSA